MLDRKLSAAAVVGMVGAGQLARMTHQAAIDLDVELVVLALSEDDPAVRAGARALIGRPDSAPALRELAQGVDVVTFDHELIPADLAIDLADAGFRVRPRGEALLMAQDKLAARQEFHRAGLPVPVFAPVGDDPEPEIEAFAAEHGWPVVVKARRGGYDGRGVMIVSDRDGLGPALAALGGADLLVEAHVDIQQELAVVGARTPSGGWVSYPPVGTLQRDGICRELVMPATLDSPVAQRAEQIARSIADDIEAVGIIAVEMFLTPNGELVINEIALRPHNSGHATIEAATTSQFHNHLRAVLDWPLGDTSLRAPAAAMVNILGPRDGTDPRRRVPDALTVPGASIHLYGKAPAPGRKVGHVTALGATTGEALLVARSCAEMLTNETV